MDKEQQELIFNLSMYEQQIQQLQQQLQAVEQGIIELANLNMGLDELVGSKDKEIFSQIGRGIFTKSKLVSEELLVDVGGKNLVKKNIPETKKIIEEQIEKLEDVRKELDNNLNILSREIQRIIDEAREKEGRK